MDLSCFYPLLILFFSTGAFGAKFTFVNKCNYTVWPGVLRNAGSPHLSTTGFELQERASRTLIAPTGWSGRFWGRTGCAFSNKPGSCQTGDCGSGQAECNGSGATPPATLAEVTLGTGGGMDFYDVSLVDGYNLPVTVDAAGGSGACATTGCVTDLNRACPPELRAGGGKACRSACEAFGRPEYCCSGAYGSPAACRPSAYSRLFKSACPRSYSYAYDDPTSTFTCAGADYTVTFCPSVPSENTGGMTKEGAINDDGDGSLPGHGDPNTMGVTGSGSGEESDIGSGSETVLADGLWMAGLAMGDGESSRGCLCLPGMFSTALVASIVVLFLILI